jgi:hypothetical protein
MIIIQFNSIMILDVMVLACLLPFKLIVQPFKFVELFGTSSAALFPRWFSS